MYGIGKCIKKHSRKHTNTHTTALIVKRISCHHSKIFFIYSMQWLKHFISQKRWMVENRINSLLRLNYIAIYKYPIIVPMMICAFNSNGFGHECDSFAHLHSHSHRGQSTKRYSFSKRFYYSAFLCGNKMSSCKRLKVQTFYKFVIHKVSK